MGDAVVFATDTGCTRQAHRLTYKRIAPRPSLPTLSPSPRRPDGWRKVFSGDVSTVLHEKYKAEGSAVAV